MRKIFLIDGNSLMFRSFYATFSNNPMQNRHGLYTNAIYSFKLMLEKILEEEMSHIFIAFDAGKQTFRHKQYKEYKGKRKKIPNELVMQIPYIKKYIDILNIKRYETNDYEADDIIASMAHLANNDGFDEINIITGDKDLLQLVSKNIKVFITKKGFSSLDEYNIDNFYDKLNIYPKQIPDYKGLVGDSSDNLPGISGIGNKTAIKLLKQFGSLENIIANISLIQPRLRNLIEKNYQVAVNCKYLATLIKDIKFDFTLDDVKRQNYDQEKLLEFYKELNFSSAIKKLECVEKDYHHDFKIVDDINFDFTKFDKTYIDIEVFGDNYFKGEFLGLGIISDNQCFFVPKNIVFQNQYLHRYLADSNKEKITFDYKKLYVVLKKNHIDLNNVRFDCLLAAYIINPNYANDDLKKVADIFIDSELNYDNAIYGALTKSKIPKVYDYASHAINKCLAIKKLEPILKEIIKSNFQEELFEIELSLSKVLGDMEIDGLKIDRKRLEKFEIDLTSKKDHIAEKIYQLAGEKFNINSVKQLGKILFEKLGIPAGKKTKTGYSTSSDVLEKLSNYPICKLVLEYRGIAKLISTYIHGLYDVMGQNNFIHPLYKQAFTSTGRLSSIEPNVQNMPIRTALGQEIRAAFVSRFLGGMILSSDYSQIELRVLAHLANDKNMIEMFNEKVDFHTQTAKKIYDTLNVTKEMRRAAKAINFGIIYGMSAWGLSEAIEISSSDANKYIEKYFAHFKGVKNYLEKTIDEAKKEGYTKTIYNRRRYIPQLNSTNKALKAFGERTAMNSPIQGSAADIIKKAMVVISKKMQGLESKMIAQVHDELVFDCHPNEVETVKKIVKESMENVIKLEVPLVVDINIGDNWLKS